MTLWIVLATLAQILNAAIVLVDKYVLVSHESLGKPVVYAFYVSMLSGVVIVLLPLGVVSLPSLKVVALSLLSSITFILSVIFLYTALKKGRGLGCRAYRGRGVCRDSRPSRVRLSQSGPSPRVHSRVPASRHRDGAYLAHTVLVEVARQRRYLWHMFRLLGGPLENALH